jgi:hypothetical protein
MSLKNVDFAVVSSYARACKELHDYQEVLRNEGYDLLVVPSRGASPFVDGAGSFANRLRNERYEDFDPDAPPLRPIETIFLPFTADIGDASPVSSSAIRRYWSRVLSAIISGETKDVAFRIYRGLAQLAGNLATRDYCGLRYPRRKFIFIDTVVSGRAICEIVDALDELLLVDCHFLLLVDENGRRLDPGFKQRLDQLSATGRATQILVDHIFTEDQGPAMSGIWTVTFPTLMAAIGRTVPELAEINAIGAGLYYHEVAMRNDRSNRHITRSNSILSTILYSAVRDERNTSEHFLEELQDLFRVEGLGDQKITKQIADPLISANVPYVSNTDISGSHVVRAHMSDANAERLVRMFLQEDGSTRS